MPELRIVIVTPERTVLDQNADFVVLPLYDGEAGVLPGHAPMIGRLAPGEMRVRTGTATERYYVEGGFVQVADNVVSVLTGKSVPAAQLDLAAARKALDAAEQQLANKPELAELKRRALAQANAQIRMCEKH
jgi:F-type H+-transporting ATPase subunit epsilon